MNNRNVRGDEALTPRTSPASSKPGPCRPWSPSEPTGQPCGAKPCFGPPGSHGRETCFRVFLERSAPTTGSNAGTQQAVARSRLPHPAMPEGERSIPFVQLSPTPRPGVQLFEPARRRNISLGGRKWTGPRKSGAAWDHGCEELTRPKVGSSNWENAHEPLLLPPQRTLIGGTTFERFLCPGIVKRRGDRENSPGPFSSACILVLPEPVHLLPGTLIGWIRFNRAPQIPPGTSNVQICHSNV